MNPHYTLNERNILTGAETVIFTARLDLDHHFHYKYAP